MVKLPTYDESVNDIMKETTMQDYGQKRKINATQLHM